jgi:hypothetical protein
MSNFIDIYTYSGEKSVFDLKPSSVKRDWMEKDSGWAYNCLPLKIANQYGWVAHNPCSFSVTWDGGNNKENVTVVCSNDEGQKCNWAKSHFTQGIVTINTDFLIKTPPGVSLYVRGVSNYQKNIIQPLDAIIETDWLPFHFPFSYRFTEPGTVFFKKNEPLFIFFPIQRDYIESFVISTKSFESNPELKEQNVKFSNSRGDYMKESKSTPQKNYIKGMIVEEKASMENHKIKLNLDKGD